MVFDISGIKLEKLYHISGEFVQNGKTVKWDKQILEDDILEKEDKGELI
jgi:hypothetical protein